MARKKLSDTHYEELYNDLSRFVRFSFRIKKGGFTPHEKTRLTRAWNQYGDFSDGIEDGRFIFAKATKSQIRALKEAHARRTKKGKEKRSSKLPPQTNRVTVTSRGIFVPQAKTKDVFDIAEVGNARVVGKGLKTRVVLETYNKVEEFIPRKPNETMLLMFHRIKQEYPTLEKLYLSINGNLGLSRYDPAYMEKYAPELDDLGEAIRKTGYDPEEIFTGFWIIHSKPHPQFI